VNEVSIFARYLKERGDDIRFAILIIFVNSSFRELDIWDLFTDTDATRYEKVSRQRNKREIRTCVKCRVAPELIMSFILCLRLSGFNGMISKMCACKVYRARNIYDRHKIEFNLNQDFYSKIMWIESVFIIIIIWKHYCFIFF